MKLAIITARGGSKRIPKKNIKLFLGKPIISYSIRAAIESNLFDEVMVSTDDKEIKQIANEYGAKTPFIRSKMNSDDFATTTDVLLEVLKNYNDIGKSFSCFCCLYPTAPLITSDKLKSAFNLFKNSNADALTTVAAFSFPPQRGCRISDNMLTMISPENTFVRSQDLEMIYHDVGQFYYFKTHEFLKQKTLLCKNTVPLILSELEAQDIDNLTDWKIAEMKYKLMKSI